MKIVSRDKKEDPVDEEYAFLRDTGANVSADNIVDAPVNMSVNKRVVDVWSIIVSWNQTKSME